MHRSIYSITCLIIVGFFEMCIKECNERIPTFRQWCTSVHCPSTGGGEPKMAPARRHGSWNSALTKKLSCCTGSLNQIIESIPENLHKDLYHTLFESSLTYGISVWGGSTNAKLLPLFKESHESHLWGQSQPNILINFKPVPRCAH